MRYNTTRAGFEAPKTNANLMKCTKERSGDCTDFHWQNKNSYVCEVSISMGLSHPFSPIVELDLKRTNRRSLSLQKLDSTIVVAPFLRRSPRHG